ncbi:MAG: ABC-F family ATP-binding cassette domain-containing protein, partial [Bacteroidales bacterium]|nr:ABC-F family ATP-binding cassette domain-containing protein [Bacteroidales bacterium]
MNILSAEKLSKTYSEKLLLKEVSIGIDETEKIGLIGVNGAGKSTVLKILSGNEKADSGNIITKKGLTVEYLSQNPDFDVDITVIQQVFKGNSPIMKLLREYELVLSNFNNNPSDDNLQKKLLALSSNIDNMKAWSIESEAKTILTKLGVYNFSAKVGILSGGQKKRIALASVLINPSQLLILDEPTNQLDNETIDWLEKYLNNRKGALLLVTHDRYFLQRVCNKIVEIENGNLFSYKANYEKYLEIKAQQDDDNIASVRKQKSLYRKELEWIMRGAKARSTKQKARIDRFDKLEDSLETETSSNFAINVGTTRLGKKTIEIENLGKDFEELTVINEFDYILDRADRIGIIGPNGSGKSTLLNLISGNLSPDRGTINTGETVKIGFFTQENEYINDNILVIEYIREQAEFIKTRDGTISALKMLEMFLFPPDVHWKRVAKLSGGEKRRLYLLKILMSAPNILLLDEPTNDLDIKTLTILENYLSKFQGAVIAVSHDRYFLDKVAEKLFIFQNNAIINQFQGNYSDYCLLNPV